MSEYDIIHFIHDFIFSIRRVKVSAKISPKANSAFPLSMQWTIRRMIDKFYVSSLLPRNRSYFQPLIVSSSYRSPDILRQRTKDVEVKKYCIQLLEKLGSFKYTREILLSLDKQAREEVAKLGPNTYMDNLLNDLLTWNASNDETDE